MKEVVPRNYEYLFAWVLKLDSDFRILCFVYIIDYIIWSLLFGWGISPLVQK